MPASPVIEEYQSEIITEGTQSVIEEGQVYQDKQTIATAMKHYSVMHKYQFRVKRSSHRRYEDINGEKIIINSIFLVICR